MEVTRIIAEIDAQIAKLQQARSLLSDTPVPGRPGRPRKSAAVTPAKSAAPAGKAKRNLSPDARKRIAEAQKRRWAEKRKANG